MSIIYPINSLSREEQQQINDELVVELTHVKFKKDEGYYNELVPYKYENDLIYLPFAYAVNNLSLPRRERSTFSPANVKFEGTLRDEQKIVRSESLSILNKTGSIILSLYTGFGKTITSINLACAIKLKTLIIVNKVVLIKQWESSILKVCPSANIQKLSPSSVFDTDSDFFIINAINVPKMKTNFFKDIGLCIVDELHLIMAESLSKSLYSLSPRYLIGLSATPYREDELDPFINFYFGEQKIIRLLRRKHTVYRVNTGFKPEIEKASNGKVNWGIVLESQSKDIKRNELIVSIVKKFSDKNFLILTKRVEQGDYLVNRLAEEKEYVASLLGSQQEFDRDSRILVATTQKAGTGFDHPKLDALILASDIDQYYIQALGRILRREDSEPVVFDLVDDNRILLNHFNHRKEIYNEIGGKIIDFNKKHPEFFRILR